MVDPSLCNRKMNVLNSQTAAPVAVAISVDIAAGRECRRGIAGRIGAGVPVDVGRARRNKAALLEGADCYGGHRSLEDRGAGRQADRTTISDLRRIDCRIGGVQRDSPGRPAAVQPVGVEHRIDAVA